jgi:hypothetical protein
MANVTCCIGVRLKRVWMCAWGPNWTGVGVWQVGVHVLLLPLRRAIFTSGIRCGAPRRAAARASLAHRRDNLALRAIRHIDRSHALRDRILSVRALEDMLCGFLSALLICDPMHAEGLRTCDSGSIAADVFPAAALFAFPERTVGLLTALLPMLGDFLAALPIHVSFQPECKSSPPPPFLQYRRPKPTFASTARAPSSLPLQAPPLLSPI